MQTYDPLIEPRILLFLGEYLRIKGSSVYYRVKGVGAPNFDTDIDLLEIRDGLSIAYEVKGVRRRGGRVTELTGPRTLEGADQALVHLGVADYSYLVHPETMFSGYLLRSLLIVKWLPIGYVVARSDGAFVELKPAARSPIDVGEDLGRKRLVEVEQYFAAVDAWRIRRELTQRLEQYRDLPLDITLEDKASVAVVLESGKPL